MGANRLSTTPVGGAGRRPWGSDLGNAAPGSAKSTRHEGVVGPGGSAVDGLPAAWAARSEFPTSERPAT